MIKLPKPYQAFRIDYPSVYAAYEALGTAVANAGPLDAKTREFIKLGMAATNGSETGVESHTHRALGRARRNGRSSTRSCWGSTPLGSPP